jgi:hypothetical protein
MLTEEKADEICARIAASKDDEWVISKGGYTVSDGGYARTVRRRGKMGPHWSCMVNMDSKEMASEHASELLHNRVELAILTIIGMAKDG